MIFINYIWITHTLRPAGRTNASGMCVWIEQRWNDGEIEKCKLIDMISENYVTHWRYSVCSYWTEHSMTTTTTVDDIHNFQDAPAACHRLTGVCVCSISVFISINSHSLALLSFWLSSFVGNDFRCPFVAHVRSFFFISTHRRDERRKWNNLSGAWH